MLVPEKKATGVSGAPPPSDQITIGQHSSNVVGHDFKNVMAPDIAALTKAELVIDPKIIIAIEEINRAVQSLKTNYNVAPCSYLIGGFIRDTIQGKLPIDADIEVFGVTTAQLQAALEEIFPGNVHQVGQSFPVFNIDLGDNRQVQVMSAKRLQLRTDGNVEILDDPTLNVVDGMRRKDYTCNALCFDLAKREIVDPLGALEDLEKHVLRVIDPETLAREPRLFFRGIQLAARCDLNPDSATLSAMKNAVTSGAFDKVDPEIIGQQMRKLLLLAERPSKGFELMYETGLVARIFPELAALRDAPQNPKWHPEGNVWNHVMMVLDEGAKIIRTSASNFSETERYLIMLTCLSHDLGKVVVGQLNRVNADGLIHHGGHEIAGLPLVKQLLRKLGASESMIGDTKKLTACHMRPSEIFREWERRNMSDAMFSNKVRMLVRDIYPVRSEVFLAFKQADSWGRGDSNGPEPSADLVAIAAAIKLHDFDRDPRNRLITGQELLDVGIERDRFGEIIQAVEKARDNFSITNKTEALLFVRKRYLITRSDLDLLGVPKNEVRGRLVRTMKTAIQDGTIKTRSEALALLSGLFQGS